MNFDGKYHNVFIRSQERSPEKVKRMETERGGWRKITITKSLNHFIVRARHYYP